MDTKYQAMFNGTCQLCGQDYPFDTWIVRLSMGKFAHVDCPPVHPAVDRLTR